MEQRISMIALGVADLQKSQDFYEKGLGWKVHAGSIAGKIAFYQAGGLVFSLFPSDELDKDRRTEGHRGIGNMTIAYNARTRDEVDAVIEQARAAGATILKEPQEVFWGGYSSYFADGDNHVWEVAHNPFWTIDGYGNVSLGDEPK